MTDEETPPVEPKYIPGRFPTKGMPFDRADLAKATKREMDAAHRSGKRIDWEEARTRGYRSLIILHFPSFHKRKGLTSEV